MRSTFLAALALSGLLATTVPVCAQTKDSKIGGKTADEWLKELKSPDPSVQQNAIGALTQFGSVIQQKTGPAFITILLSDPSRTDNSVKVNAAIAIGTIGLDARDMDRGVAALIQLLNSTQSIVRLRATMALGQLGHSAKAAIPKLTEVTIKDRTSWEIRKAAANALGSIALDRMNGPDTLTIAALTRAISGPYADVCALVRLEAIVSLSVLGVSGRPNELETVLETLRLAMSDRDKNVEIWARVLTLGFNNLAPAEPHLKKIGTYLTYPDASVRSHAARSMAVLGPRAKSLIPALIETLKDKETDVASSAAQSVVVLKEMLSEKNLDAINELFKSTDPIHRARAAHMVALLGNKADRSIDELIAVLKDKDPQVLMASAYALGELGMPARKALPALITLTKHKELLIQNVAREAISKIEAKIEAKIKD